MKLFIYKCIIIFFLVIIGFQLTFNYAKKEIERKIDEITSKENIDIIKDSLRDEIKKATEKNDLIKEDDVILFNNLIEKIKDELKIK
jgi:cell division protein YceG involved in septum cleavage